MLTKLILIFNHLEIRRHGSGNCRHGARFWIYFHKIRN
jgi:hypothetical protein